MGELVHLASRGRPTWSRLEMPEVSMPATDGYRRPVLMAHIGMALFLASTLQYPALAYIAKREGSQPRMVRAADVPVMRSSTTFCRPGSTYQF